MHTVKSGSQSSLLPDRRPGVSFRRPSQDTSAQDAEPAGFERVSPPTRGQCPPTCELHRGPGREWKAVQCVRGSRRAHRPPPCAVLPEAGVGVASVHGFLFSLVSPRSLGTWTHALGTRPTLDIHVPGVYPGAQLFASRTSSSHWSAEGIFPSLAAWDSFVQGREFSPLSSF